MQNEVRSIGLILALLVLGLSVSVPSAKAGTLADAVSMHRNMQTRPVAPNTSAVSQRRTIPLPSIVGALQSQLPYRNMNYIGVERFDPQTGIYALRFLNGRQVIVVVVDGRNGRILDRGF
jgi:hypothetical protein